MSDRSAATLWCRPEDVEKLRDYGFDFDSSGGDEDLDGRAARFFDGESAGGFAHVLPKDVPYVWRQGAHYASGAYVGYCDGRGNRVERESGHDGEGYVIQFDDEGAPNDADLARVSAFHRARLQVMREIGMEAGEEEETPCGDQCVAHAPDCDGFCDHTTDTHRNACLD